MIKFDLTATVGTNHSFQHYINIFF